MDLEWDTLWDIYTQIYTYITNEMLVWVCLKMEKTHLELYYREVPLGTWLKGDLTPKFRWGCNGDSKLGIHSANLCGFHHQKNK